MSQDHHEHALSFFDNDIERLSSLLPYAKKTTARHALLRDLTYSQAYVASIREGSPSSLDAFHKRYPKYLR